MIYFLIFYFHIRRSYYWYNRQELLQKAKKNYYNCGGKEKATEYYLANKYVIKKQIISKKICLRKTKEAERKYNQDRSEKVKERSR